LWSSNLVSGFTVLTYQIDHPQKSFTDTTHNAESAGFYKIKVQLK